MLKNRFTVYSEAVFVLKYILFFLRYKQTNIL